MTLVRIVIGVLLAALLAVVLGSAGDLWRWAVRARSERAAQREWERQHGGGDQHAK